MSGDERETGTPVVDLPAIARAADRRVAWSGASDDLHLNLVVLATSDAIEEHVNVEVDVLLVGIEGTGTVTVDDDRQTLGPGQAIMIAKGAHRAIAGTCERFAYLSCHRRRGGLMPLKPTRR
jgi:mannose-6-phosphate isomerase-like protein (cupin superfamily)